MGSRTAEASSETEFQAYRGVLNTPGMARVHDYQRLFSYGIGIAIAIALDFPGWRGPAVLATSAVLLVATLTRLIIGTTGRVYFLALIDLFTTGLIVAVATASTPITIPAVLFIAAAIVASFNVPIGPATLTVLAAGTPAIVVSAIMDQTHTGLEASYQAVLVLIVVALILASFLLGAFVVRLADLMRRLRHRESQLNAILAGTPVGLAAVGPDLEITTLAGNIDGWLDAPDGRLLEGSQLARLVQASGGDSPVTSDISAGDRTYSITCEPGTDGEALLTVYDVTDRVVAQRHLEDVVRSKDQFIAAVSHELRTPLASVVGFSELIREQVEGGDPLEPMVVEVVDQSSEMAAIIDDLLIAARASFESVPTAPRHIDLAEEAAAVIDTMGSRLTVSPERALSGAAAYADPIRVRQIIRNLLTNADRYGGDEVTVATFVDDGESVLAVRDTGDPLPTRRRALIFEPYESSGPVRGQPAAIGLGLSVSRTLAELMGGSIGYDHDGGGSVFELRLPRNPIQIPGDTADTGSSDGGRHG